jgi:hypothetical protein
MKTILLLALLCSAVCAEEIRPLHIAERAIIDGRLNEDFWPRALVISDFRQRFPVEGARPTENTEVLLAYNADTLFVGVRAFDSHPNRITGTVMKRDDFEIVKNDQFVIAIDSYNDGRNGYWFSTNPLGVRVDAQFFDEGDIFEDNWNGVWDCQARITEDGWTAELAIPFSTLRFKQKNRNVMGINFFRRIIRSNEQLFAPPIPLQYSNGTPNVSVARKYVFENISGHSDLQLKPFLTANSNETSKRAVDGGLDLRYRVSDSFAGLVSMNTDFADADVDDRQLNLTRFPLFFPEKRDFFLESSGLFSFGLPEETELFFSRRIGLAGDETVPILAGAKLTGKAGKFDLGFLDVQTKSSLSIGPENFGVFRLKAGVASRSYVGAIFTNKISGSSRNNQTLGLDWNLYFLPDVSLTGFAAGTETAGDLNSAFCIAVLKQGERSSFRLGYTDVALDFDPAIGFVRRPGTQRWDASLNLPFYFQKSFLRRIVPGYEFVRYGNHEGVLENATQRWKFQTDFQSDDSFMVFADRNEELLPTDFPIFGSVTVPAGRYTFYDAGFSIASKPGRTFAGELNFTAGELYNGRHLQAGASLQWKASRHLTLSGFYDTDIVRLPTGNFRAQLVRSRFDFSLNTHLSVGGIMQYDNATGELGTNIRFGYLFREGRQLFLVYNRTENKNAMLLKFTYLFDL